MSLESGDYSREDSDFELQCAIQRLQGYAQTLRSKLDTEKMWLASLKSETQLMLAQRGSPFPDGCHLPQCPMSKKSLLASDHQLRANSPLVQSQASLVQPQSDYYSHPTLPTPYQCPQYSDVSNPGNLSQNLHENLHSPGTYYPTQPSEEMQRKIERQNYLQQLSQLDYMCKQEMARINQVGYELEPLNQIASDWNFQAQLSIPKKSVKDYIGLVMAAEEGQNVSQDGRLFVQSTNCDQKMETNTDQFVTNNVEPKIVAGNSQFLCKNTDVRTEQIKPTHTENVSNQRSGPIVNSVKFIGEELKNPSTRQNRPETQLREGARRKIVLKSEVTVLPLKDNPSPTLSESPAKCETIKRMEIQESSNVDKKEIQPQNVRNPEVAPIVWGRLAVDKKKKRLKPNPPRISAESKEDKSVNDTSSNDSDSNYSEDDPDSGDNHFTSAVEREFLKKYMYSDSDYVYSPLFVSEAEETE